MSRGAYRIDRAAGDLVETFVAAPGPAGWRWFGRVHDPATGEEVYVVDHVVDAGWRTVRFRLLDREAGEIRVEPSGDGMTVTAADETRTAPGADVVWSPSPASLVILEGYLQGAGRSEAGGILVMPSGGWEPVTVELHDRSTVVVNGSRLQITWRGDEPEQAEGWFELLPEGHPLRP